MRVTPLKSKPYSVFHLFDLLNGTKYYVSSYAKRNNLITRPHHYFVSNSLWNAGKSSFNHSPPNWYSHNTDMNNIFAFLWDSFSTYYFPTDYIGLKLDTRICFSQFPFSIQHLKENNILERVLKIILGWHLVVKTVFSGKFQTKH